MYGTLYVVATPIGNLSELSPRALEILTSVAVVAAEDTRTSLPLLTRHGIRTKLVAYHKFNEINAAAELIDILTRGDSVALISDAGTPCISDPGYRLVAEAVATGIKVTPICGPSALTAALSVSGFNLASFSFFGFLPRSTGEIMKVFDRIKEHYSPVSVFYESPQRIINTLSLLEGSMPDSKLCLCNDLTKLHERIYRGSPSEVLAELRANKNAHKGEYTLVISRDRDIEKAAPGTLTPEALLIDTMIKNSITVKAAIKLLSTSGKAGKNELYDASLRLRELWERE